MATSVLKGAATDSGTVVGNLHGIAILGGTGIDTSGSGATVTVKNVAVETINFIIDGGGSEITTGIKGDVMVEFACTINQVTLLADQSGSIQVDIWKQAYADFPPEDANSITASAVPAITTDTDSQDSTLTGWTTSIAAGDTLRYNVDSITTCERVTVVLKVTRV